MQVLKFYQVLSEQTSDSSAFLNDMCILKYVLNCEHHFSFSYFDLDYLERDPLSFVRTIEELLGRNSSGSGLENREYGCGDPLL
jgi:hypothetical protein